jgi:hypothetical protein
MNANKREWGLELGCGEHLDSRRLIAGLSTVAEFAFFAFFAVFFFETTRA